MAILTLRGCSKRSGPLGREAVRIPELWRIGHAANSRISDLRKIVEKEGLEIIRENEGGGVHRYTLRPKSGSATPTSSSESDYMRRTREIESKAKRDSAPLFAEVLP